MCNVVLKGSLSKLIERLKQHKSLEGMDVFGDVRYDLSALGVSQEDGVLLGRTGQLGWSGDMTLLRSKYASLEEEMESLKAQERRMIAQVLQAILSSLNAQ